MSLSLHLIESRSTLTSLSSSISCFLHPISFNKLYEKKSLLCLNQLKLYINRLEHTKNEHAAGFQKHRDVFDF